MSTDFFGGEVPAAVVIPSQDMSPRRVAKHTNGTAQTESQATNAYAVAAFVLSSLGLAPLAIACAHRALKEIKLYGGGGRGTAITAMVFSYLVVILTIASTALFLAELPHLISTIEGSSWLKSLKGITSLVNGSSAPAGGASSPTSLGNLGNLGSLLGSATTAH